MANAIDLVKLFSTATKALTKSQDDLNQADTYNHDHGDNMVEIFGVITQAMKEKKGADPADQLAYASELLRQKSQSGSGTLYAQGLQRAAQEFTGKSVTPDNAGKLIQALLGAGQVQTPAPTAQGEDVLGSLLSSLVGGGQSQASASTAGSKGFDAGDLLNAGLSYMQSKQQGKSDLESIIGAVVGSSSVGQEPYRAQSGTLVAQTLMSAIGKMVK
jgi:hypothetical protein